LADSSGADTAPDPPTLTAYDALGAEVALRALPRRPRFELTLPAKLDAQVDVGPWLFAGSADQPLLQDLDRLPLTAATQSRRVRTRAQVTGHTVLLEPSVALHRGATYAVALSRSASAFVEHGWAAEVRVADSMSAGAALRRTFPAAGAADVPTELTFALATYDGEVSGYEAGLWLEDASGYAVPGHPELIACDAYDTDAISCVRWLPDAPLGAGSRYLLRSGNALRDARGAELEELRAEFTTSLEAASGESTPLWHEARCGLDEQAFGAGCALLGDDHIELRIAAAPNTRIAVELSGQRSAQLPDAAGAQLGFRDLQPESEYALRVEAHDAALHMEQATFMLKTAPPLARLTISEIYADPNGTEATQEFVEVWNYGDRALALSGVTLSDSAAEPGTPFDGTLALPADARALLVPVEFDPASALDPTLAQGTRLLRATRTLTRAGLSNAGEPLYLRDGEGHRLSAAPAIAARRGQCLVRSTNDESATDPDSFEYAAGGGCTPGY
jgi:hypothetical protein